MFRRGRRKAGPEAVWRKEQGCLRACGGDIKVCIKNEVSLIEVV